VNTRGGCDLSRRCTRGSAADGRSVTETTMGTVKVVMAGWPTLCATIKPAAPPFAVSKGGYHRLRFRVAIGVEILEA